MEYSEFNVEEFIKRSEERRRELKKILLLKEQKRKKNIKMIKGVVGGGAAVIIMGLGIVKYMPSLFATTDAINTDYNSTQMEDQKNNKNITKSSNTTGSKKHTINSSKKKYKITKQVVTEKQEQKNREEKNPVSNEIKMVVGGNGDKEVAEFLDTYVGELVRYYSDCYGVDPNIIGAIAMQETCLQHDRCCPGGDWYNGYGVGLTGLETPDGSLEVSAYNYLTGEIDSIVVTMENACDIERNIQIAAMLFQNSLDYFNGNCMMAIQSHNFGKYMLDLILSNNFENPESIKNNYSDISWIPYVYDAHKYPEKYLSDWDLGEYGDGEYLEGVLSNCPTKEIKYKFINKKNEQKEVTFRLDTLQTIAVTDLENNVKTY